MASGVDPVLEGFRRLQGTVPYKAWRDSSPGAWVDAEKLDKKSRGVSSPKPGSGYALSLWRMLDGIRPPFPAPVNYGVFGANTALYRDPRGGVENVTLARDVGRLGLALLNVLDHEPELWNVLTGKLDFNGVTWGWWGHCRNASQLDQVLSLSRQRPVVGLNVEQELQTSLTPAVLKDRYQRAAVNAQPALIALGWIQNDVDATPISDWVALLEVFPQDDPNLWPPTVTAEQCVEHARQRGLPKGIPMFGAYAMSAAGAARIVARGYHVEAGPASPDWYPWPDRHALYAVDDTGEDWARWGWR